MDDSPTTAMPSSRQESVPSSAVHTYRLAVRTRENASPSPGPPFHAPCSRRGTVASRGRGRSGFGVLVAFVVLVVLVAFEGAAVVVGQSVGIDDVDAGLDIPVTGRLAVGALWQATARATTGSRPQGIGVLALISRCPL